MNPEHIYRENYEQYYDSLELHNHVIQQGESRLLQTYRKVRDNEKVSGQVIKIDGGVIYSIHAHEIERFESIDIIANGMIHHTTVNEAHYVEQGLFPLTSCNGFEIRFPRFTTIFINRQCIDPHNPNELHIVSQRTYNIYDTHENIVRDSFCFSPNHIVAKIYIEGTVEKVTFDEIPLDIVQEGKYQVINFENEKMFGLPNGWGRYKKTFYFYNINAKKIIWVMPNIMRTSDHNSNTAFTT